MGQESGEIARSRHIYNGMTNVTGRFGPKDTLNGLSEGQLKIQILTTDSLSLIDGIISGPIYLLHGCEYCANRDESGYIMRVRLESTGNIVGITHT